MDVKQLKQFINFITYRFYGETLDDQFIDSALEDFYDYIGGDDE